MKYILLLRGVNVSGKNRLPSADFKKALQDFGASDVQTYLASGNAVFTHKRSSKLATNIEAYLQEHCAITSHAFIYDADTFAAIIADNPYKNREEKLSFTFTDAAHDLGKGEAKDDSFVEVKGGAYVHTPGGYGRTKLTNRFFEKRWKGPATTRNWRTTLALYERCR